MTEMFVLFESVIKFKKPRSGSQGTLILKKDNPTDRPEFDDALEIPVLFSRSPTMDGAEKASQWVPPLREKHGW